MMPRFSLALLSLTGLFIGEVSCVAMTAEKSSKVIRSEKTKGAQAAIELHASGVMTHEASFDDSSLTECDVDFPLGIEDTCDCHTNHALINNHTVDELEVEEEELCVEAAKQAGVSTPYNFRLTSDAEDWPNKRPQGCFKAECDDTSLRAEGDRKGFCYYYNPIGVLPAQCGKTILPNGGQPDVKGVPVCRRAKYLNGTVNGNGGCPKDYGVVMDEDNCTTAATCLGYCTGEEMRVTALNASRHDDFPLGCFINTGPNTDGCVYYNPGTGSTANWEPPKNPIGTPICNVTIRTWINVGGGGGTAAEHAGIEASTTAVPADDTVTAAPDGGLF